MNWVGNRPPEPLSELLFHLCSMWSKRADCIFLNAGYAI